MQHKGTRKGGGGLWKGLKGCIPGAVPGPPAKPPPWTSPLGGQGPGSHSGRDAPYYQAHPTLAFLIGHGIHEGLFPALGGEGRREGDVRVFQWGSVPQAWEPWSQEPGTGKGSMCECALCLSPRAAVREPQACTEKARRVGPLQHGGAADPRGVRDAVGRGGEMAADRKG